MRFTTLFLIQVPWRIARKIPVVSGHWKWKVASSDLKHRCLFIGPSNAPVWYLFCVTCHNLNHAVDHRKRNKEKLFFTVDEANSWKCCYSFNCHHRQSPLHRRGLTGRVFRTNGCPPIHWDLDFGWLYRASKWRGSGVEIIRKTKFDRNVEVDVSPACCRPCLRACSFGPVIGHARWCSCKG